MVAIHTALHVTISSSRCITSSGPMIHNCCMWVLVSFCSKGMMSPSFLKEILDDLEVHYVKCIQIKGIVTVQHSYIFKK